MGPVKTPPPVKHPYVSNVSWALFRFMDIPDTGDRRQVYLRRLIVFKTPLCGLYIHWIYLPDNGRDPHNHPMNFWSWVVRGGYIERRYWDCEKFQRRTRSRLRKQWSLARTTIDDFHDIKLLTRMPTVTVLFTGKRRQDWGFMTKSGFVPQTEYRAMIEANDRYANES